MCESLWRKAEFVVESVINAPNRHARWLDADGHCSADPLGVQLLAAHAAMCWEVDVYRADCGLWRR